MFLMYQIPGAFILIFVALCISTLGGNKLGNKIIDRVFLNELKQEHELGARVLWITRVSLILFPILLLMDVTSVAAESYNYVYWASVTLLILLTILLLVSVRKRGGER
jgi:hypothetical protein